MTNLYVEQHGQGPDLVLIHGWGTHHGVWSRLVPLLAKQFRVHVVDLPGFGRSAPHPGGDIDDLLQVLAETLPERMMLVGWSMGGLISVAFAARYPARVSHLVCLATALRFIETRNWPGIEAGAWQALATLIQRDGAAAYRRFLQMINQPHGRDAELWAALQSFPAHQPTLSQTLALLAQLDCRSTCADLSMPTLAVFAGHDTLVPSQQSQHWQPHTVTLCPDANHLLIWHQAPQVAAMITHFVSSSHPSQQRPSRLRILRRRFERAASTYLDACALHSAVATQLMDMAARGDPPQRVLELGCGPGILTEQLQRAWPQCHLTVLDIAQGMLPTENIVPAIQASFDDLPLVDACFDTLIASMALHWSLAPPQLWPQCFACLESGGQLIFSVPIAGSLHELAEAQKKAGHAVTVHQFLSVADYQQQLAAAGFVDIEYQCVKHQQHGKRVVALLRGLQRIGTTLSVLPTLHRGLKTVNYLRAIEQHYPTSNPYQLSYEIALFIARKP